MITEVQDRLQGRDECRLKWKSIRDIADHQRWSPEQREELHAELTAVGIWTYPGLDVVHPAGKDWVTLFCEDRKKKYFGLRFAKEKHFRSTMLQGVHRIPELQDLRQIKKEYRLANNRRIDVLAKRGRDTWVIIEVKRGDGGRKIASQLAGYVDDLRNQTDEHGDEIVKDGDRVEAIVISQVYDEQAAKHLTLLAENQDFAARWLVAHIDFVEHRLRDAP